MTKLGISLVLCAVSVCPSIASAQVQIMTQWWNRPIVQDLGLNDEQRKQIRTVVRESRKRLIELRAAVRIAEGKLEDEMNEERVDIGKANAAIDKVVAARSELMRAVSRMSLRLRTILTAEQWEELKRRENRRLTPPAIRAPGPGKPAQPPPPEP